MLPEFPYHPDPIASGSVIASDTECACCGRERGYVYIGPTYAADEIDSELCPWCIADGTAADRFEAQFTDVLDLPSDVPTDVLDILTYRTPGFSGWQQEHWMFHCGDGAAYLGMVGATELDAIPDAREIQRREVEGYGWSSDEVERYLSSLSPDNPPTAYLFRCRVCDAHLAYSDFT